MVSLFGTEKRRKPFSIKTKRIEWLKAAGDTGEKPLLEYLADGRIPKLPASKCRECKRSLSWGDRSYDFDHKDNNPANNRQSNCYLVCKKCHGMATKTKTIKKRNFFGDVVSHKTIKPKVGYKKPAKKAAKKKGKKSSNIPWILR